MHLHIIFLIFRHVFRLTAAAQLKHNVDCIIFGSENTEETINQIKNIKEIFVAVNATF